MYTSKKIPCILLRFDSVYNRGHLFPSVCNCAKIIVTVLGLVGGVPGGETPRVADSSVQSKLA